MIPINSDDFWIENAVGRKCFKIDGKAVTVLNKLIMQDMRGLPLLQMQGKVVSVRNAMDIERPEGRGQPFATVKKDLVNIVRDQYNVNVNGKGGSFGRDLFV